MHALFNIAYILYILSIIEIGVISTSYSLDSYVVSLCLACVHSPRFAVFSSCKITSSSIDVLYSRGSPFSLGARIPGTPSAFGTHSELCFPCTCVLYSVPYSVAVTALNLSRSFCPASDRGSRPLHASVVWQCLLLARVTPPRL